MSKEIGVYGFGPGSRSWPVALGCNNEINCWKKCWATRTVNRLAGAPNAGVAKASSVAGAIWPGVEFHAQGAGAAASRILGYSEDSVESDR